MSPKTMGNRVTGEISFGAVLWIFDSKCINDLAFISINQIQNGKIFKEKIKAELNRKNLAHPTDY